MAEMQAHHQRVCHMLASVRVMPYMLTSRLIFYLTRTEGQFNSFLCRVKLLSFGALAGNSQALPCCNESELMHPESVSK